MSGAAPVRVQVENILAARLADFASCVAPDPDVVFEGAGTVLVEGLPIVGRWHKTSHGGVMVQASSTVLIGGPTFSLPKAVRVRGPADFRNRVIRDMYMLWSTPSGKELWRRLDAAGQPVQIVPESDPHNSFCAPNSHSDAQNGVPTGSIVRYNPEVAISAFDAAGNQIPMAPTVVLGHELVHALNNSEGSHHHGTDPSPPASQPNIAREEAATIGTGSHSGDGLTENTFRNDLGMPRRDNHFGVSSATGPTDDIRPGGY